MNKKLILIFAIGAGYGLLMRLVFGLPFANQYGSNSASGPMMAAFVLLVPLLIGMYTVYSNRERKPSFWFALGAPLLPTLCFVGGTALLLIEGSICIAMALPILCFAASVGGLLAWIVLKFCTPKPSVMNSMLLLPLLVGYGESNLSLPQEVHTSTASTFIAAKPEKIWQLINHATDIQPDEMKGGLAYMIGVPYPIEAITHGNQVGGVRKLRWAKDVSFDEPITAWETNRFIRWSYAFNPKSFPTGALDEHVLIGGKYFDLVDTSYQLTPVGEGTRLDIIINYRVSTNFNWYSAWWGRVLVQDSAATILNFYKQRSELTLKSS
jgi:hypothetical protein